MLPLAIITALGMLVMWFPVSALWHQQQQLNATATQISQIEHQQQVLRLQAKSISNKSMALLLARQQYQLVEQGQSFIQVLPGTVAGHPTQSSGDPGLQPLVSPSSVSTLVTSAPTATKRHADPVGNFVRRLVRTFEFWR